MLGPFAIPDRDRYQVSTEHRPGQIIAEDAGLSYTRTDDLVIVQVFQQGRTDDRRKAMYRALADRLQERSGLDAQDLIVSVAENTRADWSFGEGAAHFLEGRLQVLRPGPGPIPSCPSGPPACRPGAGRRSGPERTAALDGLGQGRTRGQDPDEYEELRAAPSASAARSRCQGRGEREAAASFRTPAAISRPSIRPREVSSCSMLTAMSGSISCRAARNSAQ